MQKSRKVWSKGLSFFMVLVLAFTSVFFNSIPINAEVQPKNTNSGVYLGMTLVDITGTGYYKQADNQLELTKGEDYTLQVGLGYQDEDSPGGFKKTKINENSVYVYRNNRQKESFPAFKTGPENKEKEYVNVRFKAGEDSVIDSANGKATDYIEVKGKTGGFGIGIYLSSYLIYNLKLKADFYYEGDNTPFDSQPVSWNDKVVEIEHKNKEGYEFKGWYYRNDTSKEFNFDEPITDNVELVAKYEVKNNEDQQEEQQNEVTVTFKLDGKSESVIIKKGETFSKAKHDESTSFNDLKKQIEKEGWSENLLNNRFDAMKYDWYTDNNYTNLANDNENIDKDKTYYGQLKKEKVNVTFYVNDTKQEIVKIEKGKTFTDAKGLLSKFNDFDNYDWFLDKGFKENVDKNKAIDTFIIYYGKLKSTDNNNNGNNNNDNNNNNNDNDNNNNGNNNNDNNNNNNNNGNNNNDNNNNGNNNNNNNNTTTPNTPSNDITIPEETTPLSPATTETSTTPATESKDNNDNIDIEDDDTALGTAVVDDKDATLPAKKENKIIAKKESSLNITSEDIPLGTTLPKTGGSFGIIYILFGLILSAFGIKKFRER